MICLIRLLLALGCVGGFTLLPQPTRQTFGGDEILSKRLFLGLVEDYGGGGSLQTETLQTTNNEINEENVDEEEEEEETALELGPDEEGLEVSEEEETSLQSTSLWERVKAFFTGNDDTEYYGSYSDTTDSSNDTAGNSRRRENDRPTRSRQSSSRNVATQFPLPKCSAVDPETLLEWDVSNLRGDRRVVLVTQCSVDRWERLQRQLEAWNGYASIALYIRSNDERTFVEQVIKPQVSFGVAVCLIYAVDEYDPYPINFLRNAALLQAREQHERTAENPDACSLLLVDVDFVPSLNLQTVLHSPYAGSVLQEEESVVIVPAFETTDTGVEAIPTTLSELKSLVDQGQAEGFHLHRFPQGHQPTSFDQYWVLAALESDALWDNAYPVKYQNGFEPYIVISAKSVPLYDERFQGYGLNKISHLASVAATVSSTFTVLPGVFLVAAAHPPSRDWDMMYGERTDDSKARKEALGLLWDDFCARLERGESPVLSQATRRRIGFI